MSVSFWEHNRAAMQLTRDVLEGEELVCVTPAQETGSAKLAKGTRLRLQRDQTDQTELSDDDEDRDGDGDDDEVSDVEIIPVSNSTSRADRATKRQNDLPKEPVRKFQRLRERKSKQLNIELEAELEAEEGEDHVEEKQEAEPSYTVV